jgi:hypothetical protein
MIDLTAIFELIIMLVFFVIVLYARKLEGKVYLLLATIFALVINIAGLNPDIPFYPYPQLFLSIFELVMLITSFRQY